MAIGNGLRLYGGAPEQEVEQDTTMIGDEAQVPAEPLMPESFDNDDMKVSVDEARYFGPDQRCQGCLHFLANPDGSLGTCEIVSGDIDPQGVCILFRPSGLEMMTGVEQSADELEDEPLEEPAQTELPQAEEEVM